jgi:nucleoside-diphosphate-sugar epimerase
MKVLFIGGTGLISSACSELAVKRDVDLYILNRGVSTKHPILTGAKHLVGDVRADEAGVADLLASHHFDVVVDWIAFTPEDIERDLRLFKGKTDQFIFVSSASAYQKPPQDYIITEETPLENPYWQYSRDKIACEQRLMNVYQKDGFPVTIVRPSLTYGPSQLPLCTNSWQKPYTVIDRMKRGEKIVVPGDGTSLWVFTWNADFAVGFLGLFGNEKAIGEAFHITSDEVLTWNQAYEEVGRALDLEFNAVHIASELIARYDEHAIGSLIGDKVNSAVFDNEKIKRFVPEFDCKVPWAEGVRQTLAWFEADPSRQTIDEEDNQLWGKIITAYQRAYPDYR